MSDRLSLIMKKLDISLETGDRKLSELRSLLENAIEAHFAGGFLNHLWEDDILRLRGPGAHGSVVYEEGQLRLRAKLTPPASWAHKVIRRKVEAALDDVAMALGSGARLES